MPLTPPASIDDLYNAVAPAVAAVYGAWQSFFPDLYFPYVWGGDGLYNSAEFDDWPDIPAGLFCNGSPPSAENASYCPPTDTVSWDWQLFAKYGPWVGLWFVPLVVAHEAGHAVQNRFDRAGEGYLIWNEVDLQADCIAGALLYRSANLGLLADMPGTPDDFMAAMVAMADIEPTWAGGGHGDKTQRTAALRIGINSGLDTCLSPTGPPDNIVSPPDPNFQPTQWYAPITPSGNIRCLLDASVLSCTIDEYDFPSACTGRGQPLITIAPAAPPILQSCAGLAIHAENPQPTEYGYLIQIGPLTCSIEEAGLTCQNDDGNGFSVARAALVFF